VTKHDRNNAVVTYKLATANARHLNKIHTTCVKV